MYRNCLYAAPSDGARLLKRFQSSHGLKNCYDLLGVPIHSSEAKIKQAFYRKSLKYHPDRNPGNEASAKLFAEINEAYQALLLDKREQQSVTDRDFSHRWKFKSDGFRQMHKRTEQPRRTQSTTRQTVHDEDRAAAHASIVASKTEYTGWYGEFRKQQLAENFESHRKLKETQRIKEVKKREGEGVCIVM